MQTGAIDTVRMRDGSPARSAWSLTKGVAHINHGSFGGVPREVQCHQAELKRQMEDDPVAWFADLPDAVERARKEIAGILGAVPEESVLVQNATAAASTIYKSLDGDDVRGPVFVTDHGYGAVSMGARQWAARMGAPFEVIHIPIDATDDQISEQVESVITDRGGVLVIDQITSPTAMRFPVERICKRANELGVLTVVDGAHVPGLEERPVPDVDCDFWIGNMHKFACSPRGCAILVVKNDRLRQRIYPLIDSWGTPLAFPERFKLQGTLDATSFLTAADSYRFVDREFGWEATRQQIEELADYGQKLIADAFAAFTGENHIADVGCPVSAMRLIKLPHGLATNHDEADELRDRIVRQLGSEVGVTEFESMGYLRISAFAYNTPDDYQTFCEVAVPRIVQWADEAHKQSPAGPTTDIRNSK